MTKKDYELIARIFNKNITDSDPMVTTRKYTAVTVNRAMARQFADVLVKDNPAFKRDVFLKACGIEG